MWLSLHFSHHEHYIFLYFYCIQHVQCSTNNHALFPFIQNFSIIAGRLQKRFIDDHLHVNKTVIIDQLPITEKNGWLITLTAYLLIYWLIANNDFNLKPNPNHK